MVYPARMGKWVHRIDGADHEAGTVLCRNCGVVKGYRSDHSKYGLQCSNAVYKKKNPTSGWGYWRRTKLLKKNYCEAEGCASVIVDPCQLELDHIDGDYQNNDPENIQTLCANCHRLKSKREKVQKRQ